MNKLSDKALKLMARLEALDNAIGVLNDERNKLHLYFRCEMGRGPNQGDINCYLNPEDAGLVDEIDELWEAYYEAGDAAGRAVREELKSCPMGAALIKRWEDYDRALMVETAEDARHM